ncbi:hypothetical protein PEC311524_12620 [Pectobacterium carotovorum subsp. carotovorum]|nr:hypothetical protein PEC311524_12620 [Pectobacterium carotovorum subsp. carotovorum]
MASALAEVPKPSYANYGYMNNRKDIFYQLKQNNMSLSLLYPKIKDHVQCHIYNKCVKHTPNRRLSNLTILADRSVILNKLNLFQ